jgi:hypothetical protein
MGEQEETAAVTAGPDYERFLEEGERAALVEKIRAVGLAKSAEESNTSELALAKCAAGIKCQRGTVALARAYVTA